MWPFKKKKKITKYVTFQPPYHHFITLEVKEDLEEKFYISHHDVLYKVVVDDNEENGKVHYQKDIVDCEIFTVEE